MAGYFSFRKVITTHLVRTIYALGFIVLTVAGLSLAAWAAQRLNAAAMPTRTALYVIAGGAGIVLVGNLAWRMLCEFWLLLFNMHALLVSIESELRNDSEPRPMKQNYAEAEVERQSARHERPHHGVVSGGSVLGLS